MKKYICIIRGRNFHMQLEDEPEKVCFFTSRSVKANSREEAEELVVEQMRNEASLVERIVNEAKDSPIRYVEDFFERHRLARNRRTGLDFSFL